MLGAVAVDLGASSGRFAAGWLENGRIEFRVIRQAAHEAEDRDGHAYWNLDFLLGLAREAAEYAAANFQRPTLGICSWGVDVGFLDPAGKLVQAPIAYRDLSHVRQQERLRDRHHDLFRLTGTSPMPFNTVFQLAARAEEHPDWPEQMDWLILPDLLGHLAGGPRHTELTQASTTGLMAHDLTWCAEAFALAGWPVPARQPSLPGHVLGELPGEVDLVSVASHDTASAVVGLAPEPGDVYANIGTWTLLGMRWPTPLVSDEALALGWSNERAHDGQVRLQKNIPGLYIANRLHAELGQSGSVAEWFASASQFAGRFDAFHPTLFNPARMVQACAELLSPAPARPEDWAAAALGSLIDATATGPAELARLTGVEFKRLRLGGGASRNRVIAQALADRTGLPVLTGPVEATVLGNLGLQFVASGLVDPAELPRLLARSTEGETFEPRQQL